MPLQDGLIEVFVRGCTFVTNAFPEHQDSKFDIQTTHNIQSPGQIISRGGHIVDHFLSRTTAQGVIDVHNPTIATSEWESSGPISAEPGQALRILDFSA